MTKTEKPLKERKMMCETLGSVVTITVVIIGFENVQKGYQVKYPHSGLRVLNTKRTLTNSGH